VSPRGSSACCAGCAACDAPKTDAWRASDDADASDRPCGDGATRGARRARGDAAAHASHGLATDDAHDGDDAAELPRTRDDDAADGRLAWRRARGARGCSASPSPLRDDDGGADGSGSGRWPREHGCSACDHDACGETRTRSGEPDADASPCGTLCRVDAAVHASRRRGRGGGDDAEPRQWWFAQRRDGDGLEREPGRELPRERDGDDDAARLLLSFLQPPSRIVPLHSEDASERFATSCATLPCALSP
jgi:hypothetical protein